jgi:hypothetical protein
MPLLFQAGAAGRIRTAGLNMRGSLSRKCFDLHPEVLIVLTRLSVATEYQGKGLGT